MRCKSSHAPYFGEDDFLPHLSIDNKLKVTSDLITLNMLNLSDLCQMPGFRQLPSGQHTIAYCGIKPGCG